MLTCYPKVDEGIDERENCIFCLPFRTIEMKEMDKRRNFLCRRTIGEWFHSFSVNDISLRLRMSWRFIHHGRWNTLLESGSWIHYWVWVRWLAASPSSPSLYIVGSHQYLFARRWIFSQFRPTICYPSTYSNSRTIDSWQMHLHGATLFRSRFKCILDNLVAQCEIKKKRKTSRHQQLQPAIKMEEAPICFVRFSICWSVFTFLAFVLFFACWLNLFGFVVHFVAHRVAQYFSISHFF